ncbi:diguanylate cyclase domain-containing protein [Litorivicinus lipolyticus]|uniref:GGDEF domain-containing protein n=1 Tax=Litorivicinus lipolyticus TaxID=418701 RepID=UPI003B59F995
MRLAAAVLGCLLSWQSAAYTLFVHDSDRVSVELARHFSQQLGESAGLPVQVRLLASAEQVAQTPTQVPEAWALGPDSLTDQHSPALSRRTIALLYRQDLPLTSPQGRRIGILDNDASADGIRAAFPSTRFINYASPQTAVKELAAGIVDGVVAPMVDLSGEIARWQINGLRFSDWALQQPIVIHHQLSPALAARLDSAVARLAPQLQAFESRYLLGQTNTPAKPTLTWVYIASAAALLLLVALAALWSARRARAEARAAKPIARRTPVAPTARIQAHEPTRSQDYLNEVNQQLQREVIARQAKEAELLAVQRELSEAHARLAQQVRTDPLTQLANRRHFDDVLAREWRRHAREKLPLTIVLADIDHFKAYNDSAGHPAGDECLRQVATIIKQAFIRAGDLVARYGGEEFVILLPASNAQNAEEPVVRLQQRLAELALAHPTSETAPYITLSLGIAACIPIGDDDPWELVEEADQALYQAKNQGRNRYRVVAA